MGIETGLTPAQQEASWRMFNQAMKTVDDREADRAAGMTLEKKSEEERKLVEECKISPRLLIALFLAKEAHDDALKG